MRIIKFRAISMCKDEHWVYGDLRHYNRNPHTEKWTIHDPEIGLETDVDENTIGQFTGLYDKNGKKIYEGDIIQGEHDYKHLIRYDEQRAKFTATLLAYVGDENFDKLHSCNVEQDWIDEYKKAVVGNRYDNSELLKGGKECKR